MTLHPERTTLKPSLIRVKQDKRWCLYDLVIIYLFIYSISFLEYNKHQIRKKIDKYKNHIQMIVTIIR